MDPSLFCAKCFATWLRVQILMAFLMAWIVVLIGVSGFLTESSGGDFANLNDPAPINTNGTLTYRSLGYSQWDKTVCQSSPYFYLRPFAFSYVNAAGVASTKNSYCPYPSSLSTFRFCICCLSIVTIFILFFKTPLSFFARQVWITYALLYFAAFVLDINAVVTGEATCHQNFINTNLQDDISRAGLILSCNMSNYAGLTIIDLVVCSHFFLLYTAWALAQDKYGVKAAKPDANAKTILSMNQNPIHGGA
jgi:hypothetical protein